MKRIVFILLGLAMFPLAYRLHHEAIVMANRSVAAPLQRDEPLPEGRARADQYFGEDPYEYVNTPESKSKGTKGYLFELLAIASCVVGVGFVHRGLFPRKPKEKPCDTAATS